MKMNTANKLTLLRVFLIPVFLVVYYWGFAGSRYVALGITRYPISANSPTLWRTSAW